MRATLDFDELCAHAGVSRELARELDDYGLIEARTVDGAKRYAEGDIEVAGSVRDLPSTECRAGIYVPFEPPPTARLLCSSSS